MGGLERKTGGCVWTSWHHHRRGNRPVSWCCALLWLTAVVCSQKEPEQVFLNSYVHCGHGDAKELFYTVDKTSVYEVRDDVSPDTKTHAFRDCELVFRSTRSDGHLCVLQRRLTFENCKVELHLFDGWKDVDKVVEPNKTLSCKKGLGSVEWCTSGRHLTVTMAQAGSNPSVRDVDIDLMVYDMQSIHRKASMDSLPSCGSRFQLDGSQVNVTNLDLERKPKNIFPECQLTFEYVGQEENRSLCMVFESANQRRPECNKLNYTLEVIEYPHNPVSGFSSKGGVVSSTRSCEQPGPRQWCSNSTKISLKLRRLFSRGEASAVEDDIVFYALVLDHKGGPETLPLLFKPTTDSAGQDPTIIIAAAVSTPFVLVFIVLFLLLLFQRRQRRAANEETATNGDASRRMLGVDGAGNGHCRSNGQNHYTDGTPTTASVNV